MDKLITSTEAAKILKVNKLTLIRWDKEGKFPPTVKESSGRRMYNKNFVESHAKWLDLRKRHRKHLNLLGPIRTEANKFVGKQLTPGEPLVTYLDLAEMKKAYDAMDDWNKKEKKITSEYSMLPPNFKVLVDPDNL